MKKIIVKIEWDTTCCNTPIAVGGITTSLSHFCDKHNWVVTELPTEPKFFGQKYLCADCGKLTYSTQPRTTFTVCDECWDKAHKKLEYCECEKPEIRKDKNWCCECGTCIKPHKKIIEPETVFCDCENKFPQCHCCHKPIKERVK